MKIRHVLFVFSIASLLASSALAVDIYLNGVRITGQKNIDFKAVDVHLDPQGNVLITSERYQVQTPGGQGTAQTGTTSSYPDTSGSYQGQTSRLRNTYWLVSTETAPGESHYSIEIHVNGRWVATAKAGGAQVVKDLTEFLQPGRNSITFQARKEAGFPANPNSPGELTILIGEGENTTGQFIMRKTHIRYQRRAGEGEHFNDQFDLTAE